MSNLDSGPAPQPGSSQALVGSPWYSNVKVLWLLILLMFAAAALVIYYLLNQGSNNEAPLIIVHKESAPIPVKPAVSPAAAAASSTVQNSASATQGTDSMRQQGLALNSEIHLLTPASGAKLCLGQPVDIDWQVPADMLSVDLIVLPADDQPPTYDLGTFPSSYGSSSNDGKGHYTWIVGGQQGNGMTTGAAYHVILKGTYQGWALYTYSPGTFTVNDCINSQVPKY